MFDLKTDRKNTNAYKLEAPKQFVDTEFISLGCADFEYDVAKPISDLVQSRANHDIYGYTINPSDMFDNIINFYQRHYDIILDKENILIIPGVLGAIGAFLEVFAKKGDEILLVEPEYPPFFRTARGHGLDTKIIRLENGVMDYEELRIKTKTAKFFLFSNPHNPTGNILDIEKIVSICKENDCIALSDEIWADFQLLGQKHQSAYKSGFPVFLAPSKTFNTPGMAFSVFAWKDPKIKEIESFLNRVHVTIHQQTFNSQVANVAYKDCDYWLKDLKVFIKSNIDLLKEKLDLPMLGGESTSLCFVDFSKYFKDSNEARDYFMNNGVYMQSGNDFYFNNDCPGAWLRINVGTPKSLFIEAIDKVNLALSKRSK